MEKKKAGVSRKILYIGIIVLLIDLILITASYFLQAERYLAEISNSTGIPFLDYIPTLVFSFLVIIGCVLILIYLWRLRKEKIKQREQIRQLYKKNARYLRQVTEPGKAGKGEALRNALFLLIGEQRTLASDFFANPDDDPEEYPFEWHTIDDGIYINLKSSTSADKTEDTFNQWRSFLKWLYAARSRRPVNGIILTFNFHDLLTNTVKTKLDDALHLLENIKKTSRENPPIYLIIDQIDALKGAEDYFNARKNDNSEIIGFTSNINNQQGNNRYINSELESFFSVNNRELLSGLNEHSGIKNRNNFFFLKQLQSAKEQILSITNTLNAREALIRGIYFSTNQQKKVISDYANQKAFSLYLPQQQENKPPDTISGDKAFRLENILRNVTLEESGIAEDSKVFRTRQRYRFVSAYLLAGLLVTGLTSAFYFLYQKNLGELKDDIKLVEHKSTAFAGIKKQSKIKTEPEDHLETLDFLRVSAVNNASFAASALNLGLNKDKVLKPVINEKYITALKEQFLQSLINGQLNFIETLSLNTDIAGQSSAFDALRTIKLLAPAQKQVGKKAKALQAHRKKILGSALPAHWRKKFSKKTGQSKTVSALTAHLGEVIKHDMQHTLSEREQARIANMQRKLASVSIPQRLYSLIKTQAIDGYPTPFDLRSELGENVDEVFSTGGSATNTFNRFFTREGFIKAYLDSGHNIAELAAFDAWALGEKASPTKYEGKDLEHIQQKIENLYLHEYARQWQQAIRSIQLLPTRNLSEINALLKTLTEAGSYRNLLTSIHNNTVFAPGKKGEKAPKAGDKAAGAPAAKKDAAGAADKETEEQANKQQTIEHATNTLQRNFKAYNQLLTKKIDDIDEALGALSEYMQALEKGAKKKPYFALTLLTAKFSKEGSSTPIDALALLTSDLPAPFKAQLNRLVNDCWSVLVNMATTDLNQAWQDEVYLYYAENLQGRYPFQKTANEASLKSIQAFYGKKGILEVFHQTYLQPLLDNKGQLNGLNVTDIEAIYKHAEFIKEGLFDKGGKLKLTFTIEATSLSTTYMANTLTIGGIAIKYHHGRALPAQIIWPDPKAQLASVTFNPVDRNAHVEQQGAQGEWAWFRLLDTTQTGALGDRLREISFRGKAGVVNYTIQTEKSINPLTKDLFSDFNLPQALVNGGGAQPANTASTGNKEKVY